VLVLNEGDDSHVCLALGALEGVDFIDALDASGPTTLTELDSTELVEVTPRSQSSRARVEGWLLNLQAPVYIRLVLEIHRWPRSLSSLVRVSTRRYYFTVLKVDRNTATNHMLLESALWIILVELVSILPCQKKGCKLDGERVSSTQVDSLS
jgi:hypothetical protein